MAATKKVRYRVIRQCSAGAAGEVVELDPADAALLIRDGMVAEVVEG